MIIKPFFYKFLTFLEQETENESVPSVDVDISSPCSRTMRADLVG